MKKVIKRYVILDPINEVLWEENVHYGFTTNNKIVFEARFTEDLSKATLLSKKEAAQVLQDFSDKEYVLGLVFADAKSLIISPIEVTYYIENE